MILVTVGAQMPFDRLVACVDRWAGRSQRGDVFAQIAGSKLAPEHLQWARFMAPEEFRTRVSESTVIVGHAGMGTILTALEFGKPLLVMPRREALRETRNDHQVATALKLRDYSSISVAMDEGELEQKLDELDAVPRNERISPWASAQLLTTIRDFIHQPG